LGSSTNAPRILIADDQPDILEALRILLKAEGYGIETASSPAGVLAEVERQDFVAALIDLNYSRDTTSGREGLDLLSELTRIDPTLPVLVMTAWGSVEGAVEAMRRGARDYVEKPWNNARLLAMLRTHVELAHALRRSQRLEGENALLRGGDTPVLIGRSRAMASVLNMVERVGPSDASVLITGEHGTGKEVVARSLHAASPRVRCSLVTINAGGLPDPVFESELFGHVKGAFTDARSARVGCIELADEGTLLLDEIGNMPLNQQAKLLRVLQTGEFRRMGSSKVRRVDARIITATNTDLRRAVADGTFREDLLYRLNTVEIAVPPLRDRPEDIPELAAHFLAEVARRYHKPAASFSADALQALSDHMWPGNVRELEHAVERGVLLAAGDTITSADLGLRDARASSGSRLEDMPLEEAEGHLIRAALQRCAGNVSLAAEQLGLSRSALYRRLQRHGISVDT